MCCHNHNSDAKENNHSTPGKRSSMFWLVLIGLMAVMIWGLLSAPGMSVKLKAILPSLSFLICPIMMLWMMRGHGHSHSSGKDKAEQENKSCH